MTSAQQPSAQSQQTQVDQIRRLYVAATVLALHALRTASKQLLRDTRFGNRFSAEQTLVRTVRQIAVRAQGESQQATATLVATAQRDGERQADRDLGRTDEVSEPQPVIRPVMNEPAMVTAVQNAYRDVVNQALAAEQGRANRVRAMQRALDEFAERGITTFRDRAGRDWSIDAYAEMAVRTMAKQAQLEAYLARVRRAGVKKLLVSHTSTCCPLCRPFDGQVIAVEDLAGARAAGLFHPNCRHTVTAISASSAIPLTPIPDMDRYAAQQKLRYLERRLRAAKRRLAVALDDDAERKATADVLAAFAAIREHIDDTGIQRQRIREQLGSR